MNYCWRMKEKVQSILSWEERVSSCTLSTGLPGRCIVVAIPCGRHAWADHHTRFHSQSHSPTESCKLHTVPQTAFPRPRQKGLRPLCTLLTSALMRVSSPIRGTLSSLY